MKIKLSLIFFLLLFYTIDAQTIKVNQIVKTIIQERTIALNGGANASLGGQSRTVIPILLPKNTISWYYSFTTKPGFSGLENLKLFAQLSSLALDPTGITKNSISSIQVPAGTSGVDAYLLDQKNSDLFMRKVDLSGGAYSYYREGLVTNTTHALVPIYNTLQGTYYIGLKNPSTFTGIHVTIEVVAVVQELEQQTDEQSQAITLGNLGWKAFERGDYSRCLDLSNEALKLDNTLGYVHFNIALTHLIKGDNKTALSEYAKAISITKKTSFPKETFQGAIDDLNTYRNQIPSKADAEDILFLIKQELN